MTSPARHAANRRNAARSTGPRTGPGKARASRNAHRHGLATDISRDPDWGARVEALARALLPPGDTAPEAVHAARLAAAAQVELWRIRARRARLVGRALAELQPSGTVERARGHAAPEPRDRTCLMGGAAPEEPEGETFDAGVGLLPPTDPDVSDALTGLVNLERYERRVSGGQR